MMILITGDHWAVCLALMLVAVTVFHTFYQLLNIPQRRNFNPPTVFHILPFVGSAWKFGKNPTAFLLDCQRKYGNVFTFVILGQKLTAVVGALGNKFVTEMDSVTFNAEDIYGAFTAPVFGRDVAFDVPNEVWREKKRFLASGLSPTNFRTFAKLIEDEVIEFIQENLLSATLVKKIDNSEGSWSSVDAYYLISSLNILTSTRTLHGPEVRESIRSGSKIVAHYDVLDSSLGPMSFIFPRLPLPQHRRRDFSQQQLSSFYLDIIQCRKQADPKSGLTMPSDETDLIASLLKQCYHDGTPLQDHVIANLMITLLMAGRHTSVATGSWILIYLANNPSIANDLYAEQINYFGQPDGKFGSISYDDIRNLHLLNAVIRETLRLQPPIHSISRMVRKDVTVPRDCGERKFIIPQGHVVTTSFGVSQLDQTIWSQLTKWNPHRWLSNKAEDTTIDITDKNNVANAYLPSGGGGHRCIGEQYAIMQLSIIMSCLIRRFKFKVDYHTERQTFTTVTRPSNSTVYFQQR
ncbi:lanosterol 14-alpha-demethylase [Lentinula aciculospora]|uniref:Lanosterol 14-alpha-demethylase n=1 Tax=Lentinula aciculospora TaxID=153920 RepID=A0A9W9DPR8_9AGAR|nr:lanosterol 14-alpha-demethylase [Lentinula aciculospora]